ncbi:MAG: DUF4301 family protein [Syntrophales bacterium]
MSERGTEWSARDRQRIAAEGLTVAEADRQLALFRGGVSPVRLNRPCRVGDGIARLTAAEQEELLAAYEGALRGREVTKFVPASGAASRMFKEWFSGLREGGFASATDADAFLRNLGHYAFSSDLAAVLEAAGLSADDLLGKRATQTLLRFILTGEGLNYGQLPKALLKFHTYPEGARTALEEHLVEAALYARDGGGCARLHLTVSAEHERGVREYLARVQSLYEAACGARFAIGISTQSPATNTLAVDRSNRPVRDDGGELVFRPGGHGALLANLDLLTSDAVFLKNIDNVVPDRLKPETVRWKKILGGCLITLQEGVFMRLRLLESGNPGEDDLGEIALFCREKLHLSLPPGFASQSPEERRAYLVRLLHRPLRVCGMVKNEGEPGGGPFWVDDPEGKGLTPLQVVEEVQIDRTDPAQREIWGSATHFNPVDLVCGVRDFRGDKFSLPRFADPALAIITRKSEQGRELLALELPGLWNGSMAFWNTLFVEVPLATFNPVKTVSDLLRPQHLPG